MPVLTRLIVLIVLCDYPERSVLTVTMPGGFFNSLDFEKMNEAARVLFDYTDFTSFSKLHTDVKTNNCRIMHAEWTQVSGTEWDIYY